ncbi:rRNA pseudouridine synthase [Candidatus Saccharibacteria bacterium]|nr:rRNA pseudouridine synthase [Candidatus Saccharibacteria bacterium]
MTRLNKHIARILGISRREADNLIDDGKVTVDGKVAQLGEQPGEDADIVVDGQQIDKSTTTRLIALNKPVGYVCSRKQQGDSPTIYSLLPSDQQQLKTVGRLDRDSSGIILLTNDGDFAHQMTHPKFSKIKIYEVELDKPLQPLHQQMIYEHGIKLDDGVSKFLVTKLETGYKVVMKEGRNRQIRRTFDALGYTVTKLHRTQFGNYLVDDLAPKQWREIDS